MPKAEAALKRQKVAEKILATSLSKVLELEKSVSFLRGILDGDAAAAAGTSASKTGTKTPASGQQQQQQQQHSKATQATNMRVQRLKRSCDEKDKLIAVVRRVFCAQTNVNM